MAKIARSITFKNATISMEDRLITEYLKDETRTYSLDDILQEWNGIEGINFTLKQEDEIKSREDE